MTTGQETGGGTHSHRYGHYHSTPMDLIQQCGHPIPRGAADRPDEFRYSIDIQASGMLFDDEPDDEVLTMLVRMNWWKASDEAQQADSKRYGHRSHGVEFALDEMAAAVFSSLAARCVSQLVTGLFEDEEDGAWREFAGEDEPEEAIGHVVSVATNPDGLRTLRDAVEARIVELEPPPIESLLDVIANPEGHLLEDFEALTPEQRSTIWDALLSKTPSQYREELRASLARPL